MAVPEASSGQEQVKFPSVFVQVLFSPQVWVPILHSSISISQTVCSQKNEMPPEHQLKGQQQHHSLLAVEKKCQGPSLHALSLVEIGVEEQPALLQYIHIPRNMMKHKMSSPCTISGCIYRFLGTVHTTRHLKPKYKITQP